MVSVGLLASGTNDPPGIFSPKIFFSQKRSKEGSESTLFSHVMFPSMKHLASRSSVGALPFNVIDKTELFHNMLGGTALKPRFGEVLF